MGALSCLCKKTISPSNPWLCTSAFCAGPEGAKDVRTFGLRATVSPVSSPRGRQEGPRGLVLGQQLSQPLSQPFPALDLLQKDLLWGKELPWLLVSSLSLAGFSSCLTCVDTVPLCQVGTVCLPMWSLPRSEGMWVRTRRRHEGVMALDPACALGAQGMWSA